MLFTGKIISAAERRSFSPREAAVIDARLKAIGIVYQGLSPHPCWQLFREQVNDLESLSGALGAYAQEAVIGLVSELEFSTEYGPLLMEIGGLFLDLVRTCGAGTDAMFHVAFQLYVAAEGTGAARSQRVLAWFTNVQELFPDSLPQQCDRLYVMVNVKALARDPDLLLLLLREHGMHGCTRLDDLSEMCSYRLVNDDSSAVLIGTGEKEIVQQSISLFKDIIQVMSQGDVLKAYGELLGVCPDMIGHKAVLLDLVKRAGGSAASALDALKHIVLVDPSCLGDLPAIVERLVGFGEIIGGPDTWAPVFDTFAALVSIGAVHISAPKKFVTLCRRMHRSFGSNASAAYCVLTQIVKVRPEHAANLEQFIPVMQRYQHDLGDWCVNIFQGQLGLLNTIVRVDPRAVDDLDHYREVMREVGAMLRYDTEVDLRCLSVLWERFPCLLGELPLLARLFRTFGTDTPKILWGINRLSLIDIVTAHNIVETVSDVLDRDGQRYDVIGNGSGG